MSYSFLKSLRLAIALSLLVPCNLLADDGKPDLWKIEKNGNTSYLFGSIHLGTKDMYPLSDAVKNAYKSTDNLVVEVDSNPSLIPKPVI